MAAHGAYRLHRMACNVANVLAIESRRRAGLRLPRPLPRRRRSSASAAIRARVPALDDDRFFAPDIASVADMVLAGVFEGRPPSPRSLRVTEAA